MTKINYQIWLKEKGLAKGTIRLYGKLARYYGKQPLTTENITQFIRQLTKKLAPPTCQLYLAGLVSYAKFLQTEKTIQWAKIHHLIPTQSQRFFTTINQRELLRLKLARFEQQEEIWHRNNLILELLFYSGIRVSELTNIRHRDWENNSLRIQGKGNKVRYVFLPPFLTDCFKLGAVGYLFTNPQEEKLTSAHIRRLIKRRVELAKINKWISPHTFRRSFATLLNSKGARLTTIQKLLGHSNLETTASYIHNSWEELYSDYSRLWLNQPNQSQNHYDK